MYAPRTLIVSDHPFNGECLLAMLSSYQSVKVINKVTNYSNSYKMYDNSDVDVLLIDVYEDSSHEQIKSLFDHFQRTRKLVVSSSDNQWLLSELIHMGADGCFLTTAHANMLCEAIITVFNSKYYLPEELHDELLDEMESRSRKKIITGVTHSSEISDSKISLLEALTKRELEILQLMAQGETSAEIAEKLFISELTVNTHRKHILKKSGFSNTPSLVRCAMEQGII